MSLWLHRMRPFHVLIVTNVSCKTQVAVKLRELSVSLCSDLKRMLFHIGMLPN